MNPVFFLSAQTKAFLKQSRNKELKRRIFRRKNSFSKAKVHIMLNNVWHRLLLYHFLIEFHLLSVMLESLEEK